MVLRYAVFDFEKFGDYFFLSVSLSSFFLRVHWASWMFILLFFIKLGKFSFISSNIFPDLFYLLLGISLAWWCITCPLGPVWFSSVIFFFMFLRLNHFCCLINIQLCWSFFLLKFSLKSSREYFTSVIEHFSAPEFLYGFFLGFLALCWYFHFAYACFHDFLYIVL